MFDTILFDLDGTLTDPGEGITKSVEYALKKFDIVTRDRRELYKFIGPPLKDSFMKYYGFDEEKLGELHWINIFSILINTHIAGSNFVN